MTVSDLVNFAPHPGVDHMQPNGWAVIGLDTNFYATGGAEIEQGSLLGATAEVRFVPSAWTWTYGDGRAATRPTAGASWAAQGIPDFDATTTSHVYTGRGNYTIRLAITYSAQYRYGGGGWIDVIGTLDAAAAPLTITAGTAKTVLVARDCTQNPSGPGC